MIIKSVVYGHSKLPAYLNVQHEFIWRLSGGQQHLLALAGAIAMRPKLLID